MTDVTNSETVDYNEAMEPIRDAAKEVNETPQQEEKLIGKLPDEVVEHITPKTKKKSAKEIFADSTGSAPVETEEPIVDDGILDLKIELPEVTKEDLGLTSSVEDGESTSETEGRSVYQASAVEVVPAPVRDGMQLAGLGRRRQVKQGRQPKQVKINKNTVKAFPNRGFGTVNKTTFKG